MANDHDASLNEATFLAPGTFLMVRGKFYLCEFEQSLISADGEVPAPSERTVILDPIPSSDPNEPLVSHCATCRVYTTS